MVDRVMIFIDGSYLFHAARDLGLKLDYEKLQSVLTQNRKLVRPYYYGTNGKHPGQDAFHNKLRYMGFEVDLRPLRQYGAGKPFEKGVDVALVTDMLTFAFRDSYDAAILVSGDKDYVKAVKRVKEIPKRVEVAAFEHSIAEELKLTADSFISLTKVQNDIQKT